MKLFRKTLLFFIGVIVFQSVLTLLLVTNVTRRANLAEARKELEGEAAVLYEGFNSWKRQIWGSLISLSQDRRVAGRASRDRGRLLREMLLETKVDAIVLKSPTGTAVDIVQEAPGTLVFSDVQAMERVRPHPYLQLASVGGTLSVVGASALDAGGGRSFDIFLMKRMDSAFCAQLTLNRRSVAAFFQGARVAASTFPPGAAPSFFDPRSMASSYRELYDQRMGRSSWNAAFQRLGRLDQGGSGDELFLGTFLSNGPFDEKLVLLDRTILAVSAAAALLTIMLSLFLSRNITRPIARLLEGMESVRDGAWDTQVRPRGGYEIARLFRGFNEMAREVAQHRRATQQALQETVFLKEYNEKIVNSIRAGIAIVNRDLVVEKVNPAFLESFELDEERVLGAPLTYLDIDIVDESIADKILSVFRRERSFYSEIKRSRRGKVFEIRLYPFYSSQGGFQESSGCVFMADDISAKTELEQKIFQAEKLSTIGMLSAGMAHEINNPLSSILTNVQNLIDTEERAGRTVEHSARSERTVALRWIEQETRRIGRIVQGLLNFSSSDARNEQGSDLNMVVREVVGLLSRAVAREGRIRIDMRLQAGPAFCAVGIDELKQVVMNLLKNSLQAISGEGRIILATRRVAGTDRLMLTVSDSGAGIPPEVIPRIFDPFFTTKVNGEGTGLGLSVVYGIVTKYSGTISVKSRPGHGTRFALVLPGAGGQGVSS